MLKIMMKLAAAAALFFCLTSCDLDLVDNYIFSLGYEFSLEDEDAKAELKEYLDEFIARPDMKVDYIKSAYADAASKGRQMFTKAVEEELDRDFIIDHIQSENDIVYLLGVLSGSKSNEMIAQICWNWAWKQQQIQE